MAVTGVVSDWHAALANSGGKPLSVHALSSSTPSENALRA
jgi:hypothetical protein